MAWNIWGKASNSAGKPLDNIVTKTAKKTVIGSKVNKRKKATDDAMKRESGY